jgi:predicted metalloendopeptidase
VYYKGGPSPPQAGGVVYAATPNDGGGWGCMWIMLVVVLVFFVAGFFIIWYVPPPGHARIPANTPMAHSSTSGMVIPSLGNVDLAAAAGAVPSSCGGVTWEVYNTSTHLCQPRLGALDSELFDRTVNPCDSFYQHTCGAWVAHYKPLVDAEQVPRRVDRSFGYVQRYNAHVLTKIIEEHIGGPVFNFYSSCVNAHVHKQQEAQQKAYRDHLLHDVLGPFTDISALPTVLGKLLLMGFTAPISLSVEVHPLESKVVPLWAHDGFGSVTSEHAREVFSHIIADAKVLDQRVEDFVTLNTQLELHRPRNDPQTMEQFMTYLEGAATQDFVYVDDVHRIMRASTMFSPTLLMQELKLSIPSYHTAWIRDKSYYTWLFARDGVIQSLTLRQWQAYVQFSILYGSKDFFPKLPNALFTTPDSAGGAVGSEISSYGSASRVSRNIGAGSEEEQIPLGLPSMKRSHAGAITHDHCKRMTEMLLPGYVSKSYLQMSCPEPLQKRIVDVATRVRDALKQMVADSSFMLAQDKQLTLGKLDSIVIRVGQPNAWDVEPFGWELVAGDYMKNLDHVRRYRVQHNFARFHGGHAVGGSSSSSSAMDTSSSSSAPPPRLDRDALAGFQSPLSLVNAMYSPTSNTISIYAGILQYPFVDAAYDNVTLFATIGSVVGHELAHALDPSGRRFDGEGIYHRGRMAWWQYATVKEYDKRVACVAQDFGASAPVSCAGVTPSDYGRLTITEDAADVMGVAAAFKAAFETFRRPSGAANTSSAGDGGKGLERQDKMRFFYSFSQMWCSVANQQYACAKALSDVHAVPSVRVDSTLRNMQDFQEAFSCPAGAYMRKGDQRCEIF